MPSEDMTVSPVQHDMKSLQPGEDMAIDEGSVVNSRFCSHDSGSAKKDMSWIGILAAGYNMSNSWLVIAATLTFSLSYGPMVTIWGIFLTTALYACVGLTIAELISAYPTTGGEYHWTSILAPPSIKAFSSYYVGFLSWFSWLMMSASSSSAVNNAVYALILNANPEYDIRPWESFLIYEFVVALTILLNLFGKKILSDVYSFGFMLSLVSFFVILITTLSMQSDRQSSETLWTSYALDSGWPVGLEFIIGLTSPVIAFCPMDGAVHLVEEVNNAARIVPRTVIAALTISFAISIAFALGMLYCISDFNVVQQSPSGFPLFEIWSQATSGTVVPVVFTIVVIIMLPFGSIACAQVASVMTWSLAHDGGLPFSKLLTRINSTLNVPIESLLFNWAIMALVGILFLFSSLAFNSIVGVVVVLQQIIMAIPAALLLYHRRSSAALPLGRSFQLSNWLGWICNIVTVCFSAVTVVFFLFPTSTDPDGTTMNYACVVLGGLLLCGTISWLIFARKSYSGPLSVNLHQ